MGDPSIDGTNGFTEDVWDDATDESPSDLQREWEARREKCWNEGYRDGIDHGRALSVQTGFDAGYGASSKLSYDWGIVKGLLTTLHAINPSQSEGHVTLSPELEELHKKLAGRDQEAMRAIADRVSSSDQDHPFTDSHASSSPANVSQVDNQRGTQPNTTQSFSLREGSLAPSIPSSIPQSVPSFDPSAPADVTTAVRSTSPMRQSLAPIPTSTRAPGGAGEPISAGGASVGELPRNSDGLPDLLHSEGLLRDRRRGTQPEVDVLALAAQAKALLQAEGFWPQA